MTIPKFHEYIDPVLGRLAEGQQVRASDLYRDLADASNLTPAERIETMSGGGNRSENRVYWACTYLVQAGALSRPARGYLQITDLGLQMLAEFPDGVPLSAVKATPGFVAWSRRTIEARQTKHEKERDENTETPEGIGESDQTPIEQIDDAILQLRSAIVGELLDRIREEKPVFLEHLVLKLLSALGYGDGDEDMQRLGQSGDGGVDGVINQDKLGLDQIYVQAKRYAADHKIGPSAIRDFNTAVQMKMASRGVFITTSSFTREAREVLRDLKYSRIILIDGNEFANLMIDHGVGVAVEKTFQIFKIDENLFDA